MLILPIFAIGYVATTLSGTATFDEVLSDHRLQVGFPLPWKIFDLDPCLTSAGKGVRGIQNYCFGIPPSTNQMNFILDWAFYSGLGYGLLGLLLAARHRKRLARTSIGCKAPSI